MGLQVICAYALGVFVQGCICQCCDSMAICDPCGDGSELGVWGVCAHVAQMSVFCVVCTFAIYGSVWGIEPADRFGGMCTYVIVAFS